MEEPTDKLASRRFDENFLDDADFDVYSEEFDDEELIDRGMDPSEAAFIRGFKKFN